MAFFDFFKRNKPKEESSDLPEIIKKQFFVNPYLNKYKNESVDNSVYLLFCDYANFEHWIKDTTKPEKFFENYTKVLQVLYALNTYQGKYKFAAPTPPQLIEKMQSNYSNYTNEFIDRYWLSVKKSILKLKTDKTKQKKIDTFKTTLLINYSDYMTPVTIEHINSIDYSDLSIITDSADNTNVLYCGKYKINTAQEIQSIPQSDLSVMRLLQKSATEHKRNKKYDLAIECLKKSNQISDFAESKENKLTDKEYLRLLHYIDEYHNDEYKIVLAEIERKHPELFDKRISSKENILSNIKKAQECGEDTLLLTTSRSCSVCSKYDNKVYSISGKSKKYPKLPIEFIRDGGFCTDHFVGVSIFFDEINAPL